MSARFARETLKRVRLPFRGGEKQVVALPTAYPVGDGPQQVPYAGAFRTLHRSRRFGTRLKLPRQRRPDRLHAFSKRSVDGGFQNDNFFAVEIHLARFPEIMENGSYVPTTEKQPPALKLYGGEVDSVDAQSGVFIGFCMAGMELTR
jgi:hypothetical protein